MEGARVGGDEADAGVDTGRQLVARGHERDRRDRTRRCEVDPAESFPQVRVEPDLEAESLQEFLRAVLIADRDRHGRDPGEHRGVFRHANRTTADETTHRWTTPR